MFSRKLLAIGYPDTSASFSDDISFRELVVWLENNRIQGYAEADRASLKDIQSPMWDSIFNQYLADIHCSFDARTDRNTLIDWLLGKAVKTAYSAKSSELVTLTAEKWLAANSTENPLANLDYDHEAFVLLSQNLAKLLSLPPCSDHREVLTAACMMMVDRMKLNSVATSTGAAKRTKTMPPSQAESSIPLASTPLGFDSGDYVLNDAAKILRLQHINELRELQTLIDEAIVSVQKITANPKTDTKLGKHGF